MKFFAFYSIALMSFMKVANSRVIDASPSFFHSITTSRSRPDVSNRYRETKVDLDNIYTHGRHIPGSDEHRGSADHERKSDQIYSTYESNPRNRDEGDSQEYRSSSKVDSPTPTSDTSSSATEATSTTSDTSSSTTSTTSTTTSTDSVAPTRCNKLIDLKANILDSVVALCLL